MPVQPKPFRDLILARVDRSGGPKACWPWTGARNGAGYGTITQIVEYGSHTTRKRKHWKAHRAYLVHVKNKLVPTGFYVCHKCDNPLCCNPAHLVVASAKWNNADKVRKGRQAKGSGVGTAKLDEPKVAIIKRSLQLHRISRPEASDRFGINESTIRKIADGRLWPHVEPRGPIDTLHARGGYNPIARKLRPLIRRYGLHRVASKKGWTLDQLRNLVYPLAPGHEYAKNG